ncbi:MAG: hypothetical protein A3K18_09210 [Lentisphaerae bacterium RIFOXYA12_64_32]|nr:MAG: hypothetical protein A3K18_09210 [Lentisphaerae bacterium RIFOXYA12_64_32]
MNAAIDPHLVLRDACYWFRGNLADTDQFLADSYRDVLPFRLDADVALSLPAQEPVAAPYQRYALTQSGVSPRRIPGVSEDLVVADSDEHDEAGHITEDLWPMPDDARPTEREGGAMGGRQDTPGCGVSPRRTVRRPAVARDLRDRSRVLGAVPARGPRPGIRLRPYSPRPTSWPLPGFRGSTSRPSPSA